MATQLLELRSMNLLLPSSCYVNLLLICLKTLVYVLYVTGHAEGCIRSASEIHFARQHHVHVGHLAHDVYTQLSKVVKLAISPCKIKFYSHGHYHVEEMLKNSVAWGESWTLQRVLLFEPSIFIPRYYSRHLKSKF